MCFSSFRPPQAFTWVRSGCSAACFQPASFPNCLRIYPLVGSSGLEPPTSRLSGVRSNHLSYEPLQMSDFRFQTSDALFASLPPSSCLYCPVRTRPLSFHSPCLQISVPFPQTVVRRLFPGFCIGGDERVRTDDPLLAKQVLSQLSYTPVSDF